MLRRFLEVDDVQFRVVSRAFRVGFGPKVDKISGLIWACDVLFVLGAHKNIIKINWQHC